jgi:uncharacterized membrane protein YcaP (DUF421 family)
METVLRAAIIYLFLFLAMRVVGKKELSGMSAFELVLLVIMGDLVQQGVTQQDTSVTAAILAVSTIILLMLAMSWISFRFKKVDPVTEGRPAIVVRNGRIMREVLQVERTTEDELFEEARSQGIGDIRNVVVGVLETDGSFSFVTTKEGHQWQPPKESPAS